MNYQVVCVKYSLSNSAQEIKYQALLFLQGRMSSLMSNITLKLLSFYLLFLDEHKARGKWDVNYTIE